jgi:hypothetical protein
VNGKLALAAYTTDGRLNSRFGQGGRVKLDHGDVPWYGAVGLAAAPGRRLVIAGGSNFATARLLDNGGSFVFDPTLIGRPVVRRGFAMTTTTPTQLKAPQPATPARDPFSSERIEALQTL